MIRNDEDRELNGSYPMTTLQNQPVWNRPQLCRSDDGSDHTTILETVTGKAKSEICYKLRTTFVLRPVRPAGLYRAAFSNNDT